MHEWVPDIWMTLPFMGLLLSIALLPILAPRFWHSIKNQGGVAGIFSVPILCIYLVKEPHELWLSLEHYLSFVILLGALYIVAGGILVGGNLRSTPFANTMLLGAGSILSNFLGTTGASMVLIRPLLRANQHRNHHTHLPVFFIIIVSNIAGLLTPLGDPPLFLGFILGVPFFWTLKLFPFWILAVAILLLVFYVVDRRAFMREPLAGSQPSAGEFSMHLKGKRNMLCLALIMGAVFLPVPYREIVMTVVVLISLKITPTSYHRENNFSFYPIKEVAVLFLGIFITMIPALQLLQLHGSKLGINASWQFFWATGFFSSFLDNAPTYLTFVSLARGLVLGGPILGIPEVLLTAISVGAVFFGALTYIGNAPNFMVRTIAVQSGWKMPSFFGYFLQTSLICIPLFLLITRVFFR